MLLETMLAEGTAGVELRFPAHLTRKDGSSESAELVDEETALVWQCARSPFRLDLTPLHRATLRKDLGRAAVCAFDEMWARRQSADPEADGAGSPRTADTDWSPVVEREIVEIGDATALRVIHRLAYQPGSEYVSGRLMIPIREGTVEIVCHAEDRMTGGRESALHQLLADPSSGELPSHPGQAFFDDPAHDADFPDHALTRVRRALRWLLEEAGLRVLRPAPPATVGLVRLHSAHCAVTPPPRYCQVIPEALGMSDSMVTFARVDLIASRPALFDVWHLADASIRHGRADDLCELAEYTARGWAEEGAQGVRAEAHVATAIPGFVDVDCVIHFQAQERPSIAVQRWIADASGHVWRLGLNADAGEFSADEGLEILATVRGSFHPMSPQEPPTRKRRRWGLF